MVKVKGVADHPAKATMEHLWSKGFRAKGIIFWLEQNGFEPVNASTLARYGQRYWSTTKMTIEDDGDLGDLRAQVDAINASGIGTVKKVSLRESVTKTGESHFKTIEVTPNFNSGTVLQVAPKVQVNLTVAEPPGKRRKGDDWKVGVFLPDMQIGFYDDHAGNITTTHDDDAIDVAHQIMTWVDLMYGLDIVVNAGDNLDFPAFSSYRSGPGFATTTQLAINRAAEEAALQRACAPNARIAWLCGNHDARITNYLADKAAPLVGLTRAGEDTPVLSIQNLCRFDDHDVEFIEPYPDSELWVNDHLRFEHGSVYSSVAGGTAAKQLRNGVSTGYGHIHRQELLQETRHTAQGPRTHFAGSPGCLCKIDGAVPSAKTGITSKGKQAAKRHENWQQGLWVFWYQPEGKQLVSIEPISIWGGWTMWRGMEFIAHKTAKEVLSDG